MKVFMVNVVQSFNAVVERIAIAWLKVTRYLTPLCYALAKLLPRKRAASRRGVQIPLGSSHPCTTIAAIVAMFFLTLICEPPPLVVALSL